MTIVTFDGFCLPSRYIIRECTIIYSNGEFDHYRFAAPPDYQPSAEDMKAIQFTSNYLTRLPFIDNSLLPYDCVLTILQKLSNMTLYCAGNQAYHLLKNNLPLTKIVNASSRFGFSYPAVLPSANCGRRHNPRYCSLAKAFYLRDFMRDDKVNDC